MEAERGFLDELGNWIPESQSSAVMPGLGELVIRSQVSPEVRVDLTNLAQPQKEEPQGVFGRAVDWVMRRVVRPEVEINILGSPHRIAPWGRPEGNNSALVVVGSIAALATAGYLGYRACRGWRTR